MRAAAPWLISLLLHSFFLLGMALLARVQPELPRQLTLDFQIIPQTIATIEEPLSSAEPASAEKTPVPAEKIPAQIEKSSRVVEDLSPLPLIEAKISEPPPPVHEIKEAEPVEMIETVMPQESTMDGLLPASGPTEVVQPAVVAEMHMMSPTTNNSGRVREEEAARQAKTISHVRGQVLNQLGYPAIARRRGWCGKLVLGFVLCADGSVENLVVLKSSGHGILDRAAMQAVVKTAPFSGGYPKTEVRLPINFQLN
jgi:protein TonB